MQPSIIDSTNRLDSEYKDIAPIAVDGHLGAFGIHRMVRAIPTSSGSLPDESYLTKSHAICAPDPHHLQVCFDTHKRALANVI